MDFVNLRVVDAQLDMYEINKEGVIRAVRGGFSIVQNKFPKYEYRPSVVLYNRVNNKQHVYIVNELVRFIFH
jgi:hypothetical protein